MGPSRQWTFMNDPPGNCVVHVVRTKITSGKLVGHLDSPFPQCQKKTCILCFGIVSPQVFLISASWKLLAFWPSRGSIHLVKWTFPC